jgi:hypothetical protein
MTKRHRKVGVIAEDDCDVELVKVFIHRLTGDCKIGIRRSVGHGCGKIHRKCNAWANNLKQRDCSTLVLIHDLDQNEHNTLMDDIKKALSPCPIAHHLICIPIQEIEAWLLSDPVGIQSAMGLYNTPNIKGLPETINSPKEYLGELIFRSSNKEKEYINTKHNVIIAKEISIDAVKNRCPSFIPFYTFIQKRFCK